VGGWISDVGSLKPKEVNMDRKDMTGEEEGRGETAQ